jgi:hypothetical protein
MNRRTLAALSLTIVLASAAVPARAALATSQDFQRVCDEFYSLDLDPARVHDVTNATITRDIGTIRMTKGVLIFSKAIEGVTPIAVFIGDGSFTVTPVRKMDRDMLTIAVRDHLNNKDVGGMINSKITEAVFIAYDSAWSDIKPSLSAPRSATADEMEHARKILKERLQVADTVEATPEMDLIGTALKQPWQGTAFGTSVNTAEFGWLVYGWRPAQTYEVALAYLQPLGAFFETDPLIVTHKKADLDAGGRYIADPNADLHELLDVKRYRMDLEVPDLQQIDIDVDVTFAPKVDGLQLVPFELVNDIKGPHWNSRAKWVDVTSARDAAGNELPVLHRKDRLLVLLKDKAEKGKDVTLTFKLKENTVQQLSNVSYSLLNTYPWFPQYGYLGGHYEIDWTIKTVKPLTATGSGKTVKAWEEEKMNAVQMIFDRPVQFPSIIFGRFEQESGEYDSPTTAAKIPIAAHSWPDSIFNILTDRGAIQLELTVPPTKPKDVVDEGKGIIKFMEGLYGPYPYEKLDVAMMSPGLGFGQSPPAFVQLTGEAFISSSQIANIPGISADFFHEFFSHEIAHQWWGHKIGWIASEDTWLSESFAEYSAGLYTMSYLGKDRYEAKMLKWKQNAQIGDPHGSIAWCNNVSGPQAGLWRRGLIYNKGPYVVHMLRMQMGLENYKKAMQSVFTKYGYTNITTDQLQRECELVVGYKLDFFFDQWFRGTGIPVFDYSWTDEPQPDGKHLVTIKISQRDKANFKQVLMPVYIYFKGQKDPLVKPRAITTADHVYKLSLPDKPAKITLDEDHDILGDMIASGAGAG